MNQSRVLNLQLYFLPLLTAAAIFLYWVLYSKVPSDFIIFSLAVPALFGALSIGLCSDRMKFWIYNVPDKLKIKGSSSHLMALWYVSTLNFVSLLLSESLFVHTDLIGAVKFILTFTIVYALLGTFLDIFNVESGLLIVRNRAARKNLGAVRTVMSYGPYYFGLLGLLFGIESKTYHFLREGGSSGNLFLLIIGGFVVLSLPFVTFFSYVYFQIARQRKKQTASLTSSTDIKNA